MPNSVEPLEIVADVRTGTAKGGPYRLIMPQAQRVPVIFVAPHSGQDYPDAFLRSTRLSPHTLRQSEDMFVDELFDIAPGFGAPLLAANFPRAYCDVNREPWELDPSMFIDKLPGWMNTGSLRVTAGIGTIAKIVGTRQAIYPGKLPLREAEQRINRLWYPFHDALRRLIDETKDRFGYCLLIDCHSMPSAGTPRRQDGRIADLILGDVHGVSCHAEIVRAVEQFLRLKGFLVQRNNPYAGGFITRHYGRPLQHTYALQVEIGRHLYMNETTLERSLGFPAMRHTVTELAALVAKSLHTLIAA